MAQNVKITIEVGGLDTSAPEVTVVETGAVQPVSVDAKAGDVVWATLKDARLKLANAMQSGDKKLIGEITNWIGGGLVAMATLTGQSPEALRDALTRAVPVSATASPEDGVSAPRAAQPYFRVDETYVPPPRHPGAPKPIDVDSLTPEEREEIGILTPPAEPADETPEINDDPWE